MFKKAFILVLLLLLSLSVFSVRLIDPVSMELLPNSDNFVGSVALGNNIELIFSKELQNKYTSIELLNPLPKGFEYSVKNDLESVKLLISVPKDSVIGDYPVAAQLVGPNGSDKVTFFFSVVKDALDVSPAEIVKQTALVDGSVEFKMFFVNNSDGSGVFDVSTNLPANWMNENPFSTVPFSQKVVIAKRQSAEQSVIVYPRVQGEKEFNVVVSFENKSKSFSFVVKGVPTMKSKMEAPAFGLPFYSFSLLPSYFVNGLVAMLFR